MAGAHEPPELATTNHSSSTTLAAHSGSLDMERKEQDKAEADTVEMAQLQYLKAEHPHAHPHSQSQHQHPPAVDRPEDLAGSASSEQLATEMEIPIELARQITDIGPPPDGGLEAWLCVFGTFFILFCVIGICAWWLDTTDLSDELRAVQALVHPPPAAGLHGIAGCLAWFRAVDTGVLGCGVCWAFL